MVMFVLVLVGCWTNINFFGAPGEIVKALDVSEVKPEEEAMIFFDPTVSILKLLNVASPVALVN